MCDLRKNLEKEHFKCECGMKKNIKVKLFHAVSEKIFFIFIHIIFCGNTESVSFDDSKKC
jgi:hypothetical protein